MGKTEIKLKSSPKAEAGKRMHLNTNLHGWKDQTSRGWRLNLLSNAYPNTQW